MGVGMSGRMERSDGQGGHGDDHPLNSFNLLPPGEGAEYSEHKETMLPDWLPAYTPQDDLKGLTAVTCL